MSSRQSKLLCCAWRDCIIDLRADQLICVDETSFNERGGQKKAVSGLIEHERLFCLDARVDKIRKVLSVYTTDHYFFARAKEWVISLSPRK